jgi:hypothetical protein
MVYEVYKRVMTDYADQIDPKKLATAGIDGMLSELDPYSVYLEEEDRQFRQWPVFSDRSDRRNRSSLFCKLRTPSANLMICPGTDRTCRWK